MKLGRSLLGHVAVDAALCIGLAFATSGFAQTPCKADIAKFCSQIQPGRGRIAQCLKQSHAQLSVACQGQIKMVAAQLKETRQICEDDLQQYCAGAELGDDRQIAQCLKKHKDQLAAECKTLANLLEKN